MIFHHVTESLNSCRVNKPSAQSQTVTQCRVYAWGHFHSSQNSMHEVFIF